VSQYLHENYWSEEAQNKAKEYISTSLNENNLLLITGAGFSKNFGYPIWSEFLDYLNEQIGTPIDKNDSRCQTNGKLDYLKYSQEITKEYNNDPSRRHDINNHISNCFKKERFLITSEFYKNLMELGFRGFATLNYDFSLELLITKYRLTTVPSSPINACNEDCQIEVKKFLDNLSERKDVFNNILHLHGIYTEPNKIILTQASYNSWYNRGSLTDLQNLLDQIMEEIRSFSDPGIEGKFAQMMAQIRIMFDSGTLNSRHKKLIWLIFARYQIFFIGFSAEDTYFMNLLDVVKDDFTLPSKPIHFVLVRFTPNTTELENDEKDSICDKLIKKGVWPIFYPVENNEYEKGLEKFVREIEGLKQRIIESGDGSTRREVGKMISPDPDISIKDITHVLLGRE
jgi:hypothetical protein